MKNILFVMILLNYVDSFSQEFPSDSIILRKIFQTTDKGGKTYSCKYSGDENIYSYQENVVYRIVYKTKLSLNENNLILVVVEAPYGTQYGHQFGYQDLYFLKLIRNKVQLVDSIKSDGVFPVGDVSEFEIVDIGKNKKALISTFASTGNHHFENTKNISLLELNKLTYLFSISVENDNSCCETTETESDSCKAERNEEVYEIVKTNSEWYNIKVHRKNFGFTKGCKESFIISESDKEYMYFNGKYIEKNN